MSNEYGEFLLQAQQIEEATAAFKFYGDAEASRFIGNGEPTKDDKKPQLEFRISRAQWRKGITTQTTLLSIRYGFSSLKLQSIYAITFSENYASQKASETKDNFKNYLPNPQQVLDV